MSNQPGPDQPRTPDDNSLGSDLPNDPTAPSTPDYSDAAGAPSASSTPSAPTPPPSAGSAPQESADSPFQPVPQNAPAGAQGSTPGSVPPPPTSTSTEPAGNSGGRAAGMAKRIGLIVLAIAVLLGIRFFTNRTAADSLEVGQCVARVDKKVEQVECTDAKADYKVLKIVKDVSQSSARATCSVVEGATTSYFQGRSGSGDVLCLGPAK